MAALERDRKDRLKSAAAVAAFHTLLGYALVTGLGVRIGIPQSDDLKLFDIRPELPPPPVPQEIAPAEKQAEKREGAASPPNLESKSTPVVAPPPEVKLEIPSPIIAADKPSPIIGSDPTAGAADVAGPGTGSGGIGTGTGSGGSGTGPGGGGGGRPAARVRGGFTARDYARIAGPLVLQGTVDVRYTIQADGHVTDCTVTRSSGHLRLDRATCEIIEDRFRYRPAQDDAGRPIASTKKTSFSWTPNAG